MQQADHIARSYQILKSTQQESARWYNDTTYIMHSEEIITGRMLFYCQQCSANIFMQIRCLLFVIVAHFYTDNTEAISRYNYESTTYARKIIFHPIFGTCVADLARDANASIDAMCVGVIGHKNAFPLLLMETSKMRFIPKQSAFPNGHRPYGPIPRVWNFNWSAICMRMLCSRWDITCV